MKNLIIASAAALTMGFAVPETADAGGFAISIGSRNNGFGYSNFNRGFSPYRNVGYGGGYHGGGYYAPVYAPVYHPRPVFYGGHRGYRGDRGYRGNRGINFSSRNRGINTRSLQRNVRRAIRRW